MRLSTLPIAYYNNTNMRNVINWNQFIINSTDGKSKEHRFEDLCRQLFAIYIFPDSTDRFRSFLESSSNNPGIETDPVLYSKDGKKYGFQAKFFSNSFDYSQAKKSLEQAVKHYSGKVDVIRLYSNKDIKKESKSYKDIKNYLAGNKIELQFIGSDEIFDEVRKQEYLAEYYFGQRTISDKWIQRHNETVFSNLDKRFDRVFNINTTTSELLSLFCKDNNAIEIINNKKTDILKKINKLGWKEKQDYKVYLASLLKAIQTLPNIKYETISESFNWNDVVMEKIRDEIDPIFKRKNEIDDISETSNANNYGELYAERNRIENILNLTYEIAHLKNNKKLICNKIMLIAGEPGIGKSHTIATEVDFLQNTGRNSVLFLAGDCIGTTPIAEQMMQQSGLDISFEEFIDLLEAKAEAQGSDIVLFIDALNESTHYYLWKKELPRIIRLINNCNFVKLVITCRNDYIKDIIPSEFNTDNAICKIIHNGFFDSSIESAIKFFRKYNIPFTLYGFDNYRMGNPLFLKLFCLTYDGTEVSRSALYDKLCKQINKNIMEKGPDSLRGGFDQEIDLVTKFAYALAEWFFSHKRKYIYDEELLSLKYWNTFEIQKKTKFLKKLRSEGLITWVHNKDGKDIYRFAYDQMNDYFCAKSFSELWKNKHDAKRKIKKYIFQSTLLHRNLCVKPELFCMICEIYAEKFHEECIDLIRKHSIDRENLQIVIDKYYESLNWRKGSDIHFHTLQMHKFKPSPAVFWSLLLNCSTKINCCFNADYLHETLIKMPLAQRDYLWTIQINEYMFHKEFRNVKEMADVYIKGEQLIKPDNKQLELLLTLFSWFLTTSNRTLRDDMTLAITEVLKLELGLCIPLLKKIEFVNDPYVLQRIYAAVFAACCKCQDKSIYVYREIAEYVYSAIFDKDEVYPDILLRDYARLIIEYFLHEFPDYSGQIIIERIRPPYKSKPLPVIKCSPHYPSSGKSKMTDENWGSRRIISSMEIEEFGWYGDFGRYVFESKLKNFDVDVIQMFNLALSIIFDELGYKDTLFSQNDKKTVDGYYSRRQPQIERIGKKYEWIAYFNILARVSDQCKMQDRFNSEKILKTYQGPWDPFIRDFDPTLNLYSILPHSSAPVLQTQEKIIKEEIQYEVNIKPEDYSSWLKNKCLLIEKLSEILLQCDNNGIEWLYLDASFETSHDEFEECKLSMWSMVKAYLVSEKQQEELKTLASKHICLWDYYINERENTFYHSYNREYPWAPCFNDISQHIISEPSFVLDKPEQQDIVELPEHLEKPFLMLLKEMLYNEGYETDFNQDEEDGDMFSNDNENEEYELTENDYAKIEQYINYLATPQNCRYSQPITKNIGQIMHACVKFINENIDNRPEWHAPCPDIIETLELKQTKHDFTYYDKNNDIAAYDTGFINKTCPGLIIRKDLIDSYLQKKSLKLIWIMLSEQQLHNSDGIGLEDLKQWTGLCTYDELKVLSSFYEIKNNQ